MWSQVFRSYFGQTYETWKKANKKYRRFCHLNKNISNIPSFLRYSEELWIAEKRSEQVQEKEPWGLGGNRVNRGKGSEQVNLFDGWVAAEDPHHGDHGQRCVQRSKIGTILEAVVCYREAEIFQSRKRH